MMLYFLDGKIRESSENLEQLCDGIPDVFTVYFRHVHDLSPGMMPDYPFLKSQFENLFDKMGYQRDNVYCWTTIKYQRLLPSIPQDTENHEEHIKQAMKCIGERKAAIRAANSINNRLLAHQDLLSEYYVFFTVTCHPGANKDMFGRALKQAEEMWLGAIQGPLETLRRRSDTSVLSYFRHAYSFALLLYISVRRLESRWKQLLKDLYDFGISMSDAVTTEDREEVLSLVHFVR
jgi:hypothetical protein